MFDTTTAEVPWGEYDPELGDLQVGARADASDEALQAELAAIAHRRAVDEAREIIVLAELEDRRSRRRSAHRDTAAELRTATRMARTTAQARARVAHRIRRLPITLSVLGAGLMTYDHARAIADAEVKYPEAMAGNEAHFALLAMDQSADELRQTLAEWLRDLDEIADQTRPRIERQRVRRSLRRWTDRDGMQAGSFRLDDETAALLDQVLGRAYRARIRAEREAGLPAGLGVGPTTEQRMADAFADVARQAAAADQITKHKAVPTIIALTDMENLRGELAAQGRCELAGGTPLTAAQLRRMACEADIIPAVLDSDGVVLDMGYKVRTATWEQRLALRVDHDHCAARGCLVPFDWCEIHHRQPWTADGPTDLANLVPLCSYHHTLWHCAPWMVAIGDVDDDGWDPPPRPSPYARARRAQARSTGPPLRC